MLVFQSSGPLSATRLSTRRIQRGPLVRAQGSNKDEEKGQDPSGAEKSSNWFSEWTAACMAGLAARLTWGARAPQSPVSPSMIIITLITGSLLDFNSWAPRSSRMWRLNQYDYESSTSGSDADGKSGITGILYQEHKVKFTQQETLNVDFFFCREHLRP